MLWIWYKATKNDKLPVRKTTKSMKKRKRGCVMDLWHILFLSIYNKVYYKLFSKSALPSLINLITNSPNSVFCHANHGRVNFDASSLWNDSWMKPMPASVFSNIFMQKRISSSLWAVKHFIMIDIGHGMSYPM